MSCVVGIVDYGIAGNIRSINKAVMETGVKTIIVDNASQLSKVDKLVLPGVGSFPDAMKELQKNEFDLSLKDFIKDKPTLGICLGMQILSKVGFEFESTNGLGIFDAEVKQMKCSGTLPHMGFNKVFVQQKNPIFDGLNGHSFYFMHSYEVVNYKNILALSNYCDHEFVSAIGEGHIFGVQFHPEKSRQSGIQLFNNFINF